LHFCYRANFGTNALTSYQTCNGLMVDHIVNSSINLFESKEYLTRMSYIDLVGMFEDFI